MFSPAFLAEFESLQLKALRILGQLLDQCDKDTTKASAALGILRIAERVTRKLNPPERARRDEDSPSPHTPSAPAQTAAASPHAEDPCTNESPAPSHPGAPLSDAEVDEMLRYFPHLEPKRLRRPELIGLWRSHLIQARYWNDPILDEDRGTPRKRATPAAPPANPGGP